MKQHTARPFELSGFVIFVMVLGLTARIFAFMQTLIVNKDATFYIQQAKALYYASPDLVTAGYSYLSVYSLLIGVAYFFFNDWILAAMSISLLFSSIMIIPLYWLMRRFFDEKTSGLVLLTFALSPPFINMSRDVIREPVSWAFLLLGIFFFVLHIERKKNRLLSSSCLAFLAAALARVEITGFIFASFLYLLFFPMEDRFKRIFFFLLPVLILAAAGTFFHRWLYPEWPDILPLNRIVERNCSIIDDYNGLRADLARIDDAQSPTSLDRLFFDEIRNLVWYIGIGTILVQITRGLYFPFFILFSFGIVESWKKSDPRLFYLLFLCGAAFLILYVQVLNIWAMYNRWAALFILPGYVFIGFGIIRLCRRLSRSFSIRPAVSGIVIVGLILAVSLPKIARYDDRSEKLVYKEIGRFIATRRNPEESVRIGSFLKELILIDFYAHIDQAAAPPFDRTSLLHPNRMPDEKLLKGFDYFILDLSETEKISKEWQQLQKEAGLVRLKEWLSHEKRRLILYRVNG